MADRSAAGPPGPSRPLPMLNRDNVAFWTGGAQGELLIHRCRSCDYFIHPPSSFCPRCEGRDVSPTPVSGEGVVASFSINYRAWAPDLPVPYVLAFVELVEQPDVRLATNITGCPPEEVHIGMAVRVRFEAHEDVWLPFFEPVTS